MSYSGLHEVSLLQFCIGRTLTVIWGHTLNPEEHQPPLIGSLQPRWAWLGTGSSNPLRSRVD